MEKTKIKLFGLEKGFFAEKRVVFKDPDGAEPVEVQASDSEKSKVKKYDQAVKFIGVLGQDVDFGGKNNPQDLLADNPYGSSLINFAGEVFRDDESFSFKTEETMNGTIVLNFSDPSKQAPITLDDELLTALRWKEVRFSLDELFAGKNLSDNLIMLAAKESEPFRKLTFKLARDPRPVGLDVLQAVIDSLESLRSKLASPETVAALAESRRELEMARSKMKRDELKKGLPKTVPNLPSTLKMKREDFMKSVNSESRSAQFNTLALNVSREQSKVNVMQWHKEHNTVDGVAKIYQDFKTLQIMQDNPDLAGTFEDMFAILANAANPLTNPYYYEHQDWFQDPTKYRDELLGLAKKDKFFGGELFVNAFDELMFVEGLALSQDDARLKVSDTQRKLDEDPLATGVTSFLRDNIDAIKKAAREGDTATLGVYAIGFYALYKAYGRLTEGKNGGTFKKWLTYGAAAYCGNIFLKNAGYDVLKMVGFREADYEVKGTPMEVMKRVLAEDPKLSESTKDLDYRLVARMSNASLAKLHKFYKKSNKSGIGFISPREFRDIFPLLADVAPFKMGLGEKGQKDYTGESLNHLDANQREFVRVGQQLYKMAEGLKGCYDNTLRLGDPSNPKLKTPYKGRRYEVVIGAGKGKIAQVWQLLDAIKDYSYETPDGSYARMKHEEVENDLLDAFKGIKDVALRVGDPLGESTYTGFVNGFPVVFVLGKNGYQVYLRNRYGKTYTEKPGLTNLNIPYEGPGRANEVKKVAAAAKAAMMTLIEPLKSKDGQDLLTETLDFRDGAWRAKVKFPGAADIGAGTGSDPVLMEVTLTPDSFGEGVMMSDPDDYFRIHVSKDIANQAPYAVAVIPHLVNQPGFQALQILAYAHKLKLEDDEPGDGKFVLNVDGRVKLALKYNKLADRYSFEPASQEADLFKRGSGFREILRESLDKDKKLNKVFDSWRKIIDNTEESYFINFFKRFPELFTQATMPHPMRGAKLSLLTGSVPKNYTIALIEAQKEFVVSKVVSSLDSAKSLKDVDNAMSSIFTPAVRDWDARLRSLSSKNVKNKQGGNDFSQEAFQTEVFNGLAEVGMKSREYKNAYRKFVGEIFTNGGWDDLREGNAIKARDIVKVFAYYTAAVDDPGMDDADLHLPFNQDQIEKFKVIQSLEKEIGRKVRSDDMTVPESSDESPAAGGFKIEGELGRELTFAEGEALSALEEVEGLRDSYDQIEKYQKFKLNADYIDYVVGRIYMQITQGNVGDKVPLPSSGFWDIVPFDIWKQNKVTADNEFIDRTPPLTMMKDYMTFDKYLELSRAERDEILKSNRSKVILPRYDAKFKLGKAGEADYSPKDEELLWSLLGVADRAEWVSRKNERDVKSVDFNPRATTDSLKKTDLEKVYFDTAMKILDDISKKYHDKVKVDEFQSLYNEYSFRIKLAKPSADSSEFDYEFVNSNSVYMDITKLEKNMSMDGRVSGVEQERIVKDMVKRKIQTTVEKNFNVYFNDPSFTTQISEYFKNLWANISS